MFASDLLIQTHLSAANSVAVNQELAGRLITIPLLIGTFLAPVLGLFVDNHGQRLKFMFLSFVTMIVGLALFLYTNPLVSLTLIGME